MKRFVWPLLLVSSLSLAAPAVLTGTVQNDCAPWDGPALHFELAGRDGERVMMNVFQGAEALSGKTVRLEGPYSRAGHAWRCLGKACRDADDTILHFRVFKPGQTVQGHLKMRLEGTWLEADFRAAWLARVALCG